MSYMSLYTQHIECIRLTRRLLAILRRVPIASLSDDPVIGFYCLGCGASGQEICRPTCWAHELEEALDDARDPEGDEPCG